MSQLLDSVPALKRAVATPGTFDTAFPDATDQELAALLGDAMAEAQLDGFMADYELDVDLLEVTPDLPQPLVALLLIYAGYRLLVNEIRNRKTHVRYEAGPTVFEEDQTASMLNELLRQLNDRKKDLLEQARLGAHDGGVYVADMYLHRATGLDFRMGWYLDLSEPLYLLTQEA